jgi:hypothetical protein
MSEHLVMPEEGQFVAIWTVEGKIWSYTLKWGSGKLYVYDPDSDYFWNWPPSIPRPWKMPEFNPKFFTAGEGK